MVTQKPTRESIDRFRGSLVGLATGDALGMSVEFKPPGTFRPISDMMGGGPFGLRPGQWTDDTSMALCLTDSLLARGGFDILDQMRRYRRWWKEGYRSSKGFCFDVGATVRQALATFEATGNPFSGPTAPHTAGNGSLVRLVPVVLYFACEPDAAIRLAGESSRTTHGAAVAVDACRYLAGLILGALAGEPRDHLLGPFYRPGGRWSDGELSPEVAEVASGSFRRREPPAIKGSGYVVESLEAALWAFSKGVSFRDGCLLAVNLGDHSAATGAVYGQLAGAYWGMTEIPEEWLERLWAVEEIVELADSLYVCRETRAGLKHPEVKKF